MREYLYRDRRHQRLLYHRAEADRLLRLVQHDSMKEQLTFAVRDLDEAMRCVNRPAFDESPPLQQIADCAIANATRRLAVVDSAVRKYGPSVFLFQLPTPAAQRLTEGERSGPTA